MDATRRLRWPCLAALIALAACGGGGGGGGSGSPGPTDPPPPSGSTPGAINQANAQDAAAVGAALLEAPVQLALAGLNPLIGLLEAKQLEQSLVCGSGAIELTTADNDASGAVSSGDVVTVSYTDGCISGPLNAPVLGEIELAINDLVLRAPAGFMVLQADVSFPGDLDVATDLAATLVSGGFAVTTVVRGVTFELLTIDLAAPDQLSITIGSGSEQVTERLTALAMRREVTDSVDGGRPFTLSATSAIQSELLGGSLECRTVGDLATPDSVEMPSKGVLECNGASGSAVRLDSSGSTTSLPALLVDPEGDGSFVEVSGGPFHWSDFVEGELVTERLVCCIDFPAPARPLLTAQKLAAAINGFVYAPMRNRLYATTDASVLEIDPATLAISRFLDVAGTPNAIAVSEDESALWVGLDASSELLRIDLATMSAGTPVPLGNSSHGFPRTLEDVHVAPGTADLVVVATRFGEMIAFDNGMPLADMVGGDPLSPVAPERFLFRTDSDIVAASSNSGSDAYRVTLDALTGLTLARTLEGLAGNSVGSLKAGAADIYTRRGAIFNEALESAEGQLKPSLFSCCYSEVAVDPQSGDVYALSESTPQLDLYAEDNLVRIGEYSLPPDDFGARLGDALLTPAYLFFTRGEFLERYERSEIVANLPQETCERLDLGGLLTAGTYVMLDCAAIDVVLDTGRNVLYAGLGASTPTGNSIAVIDLDSFQVTETIQVGGWPGMLKLSADNSTLFVALTDTNRLVEIDLDSRIVSSAILGSDDIAPYFVNSYAPVRGIDGDVIVSMNAEVVLLEDGNVLGSRAEFEQDYTDVFVSEDGGTAFAQTGSRFRIFNISSSGVAFLQQTGDVIASVPADQEGHFIYFTDGRRFDMITHASDEPCDPPGFAGSTGVGHDEFSERVYFSTMSDDFRNTAEYMVIACEPAAAATHEPAGTLAFKLDEGDVRNVIPLRNNKIVIHTDTHLVLLDRPS